MTGRIPQSFIQDILTRTDIVELIQLRIAIKKRGNNYLGLCPFHQEKTPSFTVSAEKQFYYCFGCGAHGNALGFLMNYDRYEFTDAIAYLASQLGLSVPTDDRGTIPATNNNVDYDLLAQVNYYYQRQLRQSATAIQYLKSRGITGQIAKQFAIGYAPSDWENLKSAFADEKMLAPLISNGLVIKKNDHRYFDRFRHRIMFPIRDVRGRVIAFGGRTLGNDTPKYMNSPETEVFHKSNELYGLYEVRKLHRDIKRLIVVEGYMDVVCLHQYQITEAVATLGTAVNARHIQKLLRYTHEIIFCFDGDEAGRKAGWRALTLSLPLMHDGIHIRFLFLPQGEDPDSLVRQIGHDGFNAQLNMAKPLSDVFFEHLSAQIPIRSIDDKAHFAKQACQHLETMPQGLFRQFLLEQLANRLGVGLDELQRLSLAQSLPSPVSTPPLANQRVLSPDFLAVALLLQRPQLISAVADVSDLAEINSPGIPLLLKLIALLQKTPMANTGVILEQWPTDEERGLIASLAARYLPLAETDDLAAELHGAFHRLREQQADALAAALIQKAKTAGLSSAEKEILQKLLKKSVDIPT
jgi:DNA primase